MTRMWLQEEQWTTVGDLRRKLAWQQHTVDGWSVEAYATQAGFPQTSSEAAGAPPSRLHTTNRCASLPECPIGQCLPAQALLSMSNVPS